MAPEKELLGLNDIAPPSYHSLFPEESKEKTVLGDKAPINNIIASISRMDAHFPRYQDQCASLSENQKIRISAATLAKDISRLARGQYSNQRAVPSSQILIQRIAHYNQQGLAQQRFAMSEYQQKRLDMARVGNLVHRMERSRLENQDWKCRSQVCEEELQSMFNSLDVAEDAPLRLQRYSLSGHQQRNMFIHGMLGRVDRIEGFRMENQDAVLQTTRKEKDFADLEKSLNRLPQSMNDQRAISRRRVSL